jgi:hypothetical protein
MSKKASKNQRELKVYTKYVLSRCGKASILPEIRLKGHWVKEWGYNCGNIVNVLKAGDSIIIRNQNVPIPTVRL